MLRAKRKKALLTGRRESGLYAEKCVENCVDPSLPPWDDEEGAGQISSVSLKITKTCAILESRLCQGPGAL